MLDRNVKRDSTGIPMVRVDPTECEETEAAVQRLPPALKEVVQERWIKRGTVLQMCRAIGCSRATFYARLDRAYAELLGNMNDVAAGL